MSRSIHVTRCKDYDPERIRKQVIEHLDLYPAFRKIEGKKILLKINLLSAHEPDKAITTHPELVKAVVQELQERGARVMIGDSPGGLFNKPILRRAYEATGMTRVSMETGCELNFNTDFHTEKFPEGRFVKSFNICNYLRDSDMIIAMPKIKTHMFTGLTCASKIMFGIVPGTQKVKYHTRFPDTTDFSRMLFDLTELAGVDLFIVDGVVGMEGKGPSQGDPRHIGVLISGTDPQIIDLHVARIAGLNPEKLAITRAARLQDRISFDMKIDVTGDGKDFSLEKPLRPAKGGALAARPPRFLQRAMINLATRRPKVSIDKCTGCGVCRDNCAGGAIRIVRGKARIDYSKCIRCYCCHELCPNGAIYLTVRESGLANYIEDQAYNYFVKLRE